MNLSWYIVQVVTNMEDKIQKTIISKIIKKIEALRDSNQTDKLIQFKDCFNIDTSLVSDPDIDKFLREQVILVPKEKVEELRSGKKYIAERKIYPSYILIKMKYNDDCGLLITKNVSVIGFVGVGKDSNPIPIPQHEVDRILFQVEKTKEKAKYKLEFDVGEVVRVIDGPFVDFTAIIEEVIYNKSKLKVTVQIFGRDTSVELDFSQVEKSF